MARQESYHPKLEKTEPVNPDVQNRQNIIFPEAIKPLDPTQVEILRKEPEDADDAVGWFIFVASQRDLLTFEQEVNLARRYDAGKQALLDLENQNISLEERKRLQSFADDGHFARRELLLSNIRLVISIAKKRRNRGLLFQDLISYGFIGLIKAAERYDVELGYKFSTYATWWIRQAIERALSDEGRTIRIPVHIGDWYVKFGRAHKLLEQKLEREPTKDELAEKLNMNPQILETRLANLRSPISMNVPIGSADRDSVELGDFIKDPNAQTTRPAEDSQLAEWAALVLKTLDERKQIIFKLRYGLFDGREHTLAEIGERFGLSRERIRQLVAEALMNVRNNPSLIEQACYLLDKL